MTEAPQIIATCIGCGCTDEAACPWGCEWRRVDYRAGLGVCSSCPEHEARWDAGDRTVSADLPLEPEDGIEFDGEPESLLLPGDIEYSQTLSYLRDRKVPR